MDSLKPMDSSIRVFCRFRPMSWQEEECSSRPCLNFTSQSSVKVILPKDAQTVQYSFEKVFDGSVSQSQVYQQTTRSVLSKFLDGFNASIIAYGQTSSGKTYTMQGPEVLTTEHRGIIPRVATELFQQIESRNGEYHCRLKLSVLEIYLEKVRDLLDTSRVDLKIREDPLRGVYVEHLSEAEIASERQLYELLLRAHRNRVFCSTNCNERSSRSHLIVTLTLQQSHRRMLASRSSKLSLVDLAGSEKVNKAGITGKNLQEANSINSSLSSLSKVITAIAAGKSHIPYRQSKLTRILEESVGGNSFTVFILTCSPSSINLSETISTLRFGDSSQKIRNRPKVNRELSYDELRRQLKIAKQLNLMMSNRIRQLQEQLKRCGAQAQVPYLPVMGECNRCRSTSYGKLTPPESNVLDRSEPQVAGFLSDRVLLTNAYIEQDSQEYSYSPERDSTPHDMIVQQVSQDRFVEQQQEPIKTCVSSESQEFLLEGVDDYPEQAMKTDETFEIPRIHNFSRENPGQSPSVNFIGGASLASIFPSPLSRQPSADTVEADCRRKLEFTTRQPLSSPSEHFKPHPTETPQDPFDAKIADFQQASANMSRILSDMRQSKQQFGRAWQCLMGD